MAETEDVDFSDSRHLVNRQRGLSISYFDPAPQGDHALLKGIPKSGKVSEGAKQLPAVAVWYDGDGRGSWKPCVVLARRGTAKLLVEWADDRSRQEVLRLHCLLEHEDIRAFCRRVGVCLRARTKAESYLRYNLFIDNMPFSGNPVITDRQVVRIHTSAMNNERLQKLKASTSMESLMSEVNTEYNRTINKMVLDAMLVDHAHKDGFRSTSAPRELASNH